VDAAVDMRFGGEIDDGARLVFGQQLADQREIADVALTKRWRASPSSARFSRLPA
jgi:hypothetical protein